MQLFVYNKTRPPSCPTEPSRFRRQKNCVGQASKQYGSFCSQRVLYVQIFWLFYHKHVQKTELQAAAICDDMEDCTHFWITATWLQLGLVVPHKKNGLCRWAPITPAWWIGTQDGPPCLKTKPIAAIAEPTKRWKVRLLIS